MADLIRFTCEKPARLLYSSLTVMSKPKNVANAEDKFSGVWGIDIHDFNRMLPIMVKAITEECGSFSGNPADYYLACMSGTMAAQRTRDKAKLDAAGKGSDEAFKIIERAEKLAALYEGYAGILRASSKYEVSLGRLEMGTVKDIEGDIARAQAGKDLFYPGAYTAPSIDVKGFRRKTLDAKDGCTAYIKNCLWIAKGPRIETGGGGAPNSEIFGGFNGFSDFDPTAMAPGGGSVDLSAAFGGTGTQTPPPPPVTAAAPPPPPPPPADPMVAARAAGWAPHPSAPGFHYKGQDVKADADVAAMFAGPSLPPPPPAAGVGGLPVGEPAW